MSGKSLLTEVLPSSGLNQCDHNYKAADQIKEGTNQILVVCAKCGDSKWISPRPIEAESKKQKPLLME